jgi:hypothetical protein
MKFSLFLALVLLSRAHGWMTQRTTVPRMDSPTFAAGNGGSGDDVSSPTDMQNPCWQDFYDEDCETNFAAASFVASKWIKSMPCGAGIEVGCATFCGGFPVASACRPPCCQRCIL